MAQVRTQGADSLEGAEEEAGRASVGFQVCWSSVCIRQGMPEKQESSIYCKPRGQREDVLTCQFPRCPGVRDKNLSQAKKVAFITNPTGPQKLLGKSNRVLGDRRNASKCNDAKALTFRLPCGVFSLNVGLAWPVPLF